MFNIYSVLLNKYLEIIINVYTRKGEEKMYSCQFSVWQFKKNTKPSLGKEKKQRLPFCHPLVRTVTTEDCFLVLLHKLALRFS